MAVLAVRFLTEIAMLVALAYAGARLGEGAVAWFLGVALPIAAIVVWQQFVAPKARHPVTLGQRIAIEAALFVGTGILLALADLPTLGLLFAVIALVVSAASAATEGIGSPWDEPR
jgi:Protein of unknown function (DUF2568)